MASSSYKIGDLVWAKVKGFAPWPGKVVEANDEAKPIKDTKPKQCIFFFSTEKYAWVVEDQIWDYLEKRGEFVQPCPKVLPSFKNAIDEIECLVTDRPNFTPIDPNLLIGTSERGVVQEFADSAERSRSRKRTLELKQEEQAKNVEDTKDNEALKMAKLVTAKRMKFVPKRTPSEIWFGAESPERDELYYKYEVETDSEEERCWQSLPDVVLERPCITYDGDEFTGDETLLTIGFLGLGKLGSVLARALLDAGRDVTVWNRTPSKCKDFVSCGAKKGSSPAEVVKNCDITISCLSDATALKELVTGMGGYVLQEIGPGKSFIDMSTCDTETIREINELITSRGGKFLEAPIIGTLDQDTSDKHSLIALAAGDKSLYNQCFMLFGAIAKKTFYIGEVGSAASMKLCTSILFGTMLAGVAECLALGEKVGLRQQDILTILSLLPLNCALYKNKGLAMINSEFNPPYLSLEHMQRDLKLAISLSESVEQPVSVTTATNELFKRAKSRGYGDHDTAAIYRAIE